MRCSESFNGLPQNLISTTVTRRDPEHRRIYSSGHYLFSFPEESQRFLDRSLCIVGKPYASNNERRSALSFGHTPAELLNTAGIKT
jgi:hypothetical protein